MFQLIINTKPHTVDQMVTQYMTSHNTKGTRDQF